MRKPLLLACLAVLCSSSWAAAAPTIVGFSGTIDLVDDPFGDLPPGIVVGSTFAGTYTLDPDSFPNAAQPFVAFPEIVQHSPGPGALDVNVEGNVFTEAIDQVFITDDNATSGDGWLARANFGTPFVPFFDVSFLDSTSTRVNDPFAFFVNSSLNGWDSAKFVIRISDDFFAFDTLAEGTIADVFIVPEPSTALLLGLGLVGMTLRRHA